MKAKVLVVDDEDHILEAFWRNFRNQFDIHCANDGWEGLEVLEKEGPFEVVVSDWKMPNIDGIQFLGEAMRRSPDTVRIMLTGHGRSCSAPSRTASPITAAGSAGRRRIHHQDTKAPRVTASRAEGADE